MRARDLAALLLMRSRFSFLSALRPLVTQPIPERWRDLRGGDERATVPRRKKPV